MNNDTETTTHNQTITLERATTEVNPFIERPATEVAKPSPEQAPSAAAILIVDGCLSLTNIEQVWRTARLFRQSGMVPASFRNDQQIVIAILRALELKIPIFQALEGMTIINNRVGIMGDLALAMCEASGLLQEHSKEYVGEGEELECKVTLKRKGRKAEVYSFSVRQARVAGIYERSAVWRNYPERMCYYRALGFGLRDEFADVLKGIKTTEELQDYPQENAS